MGIYQETSSHATRLGTLGQSSPLAGPLWTDPGLKSGISLRELISTLKKKKAQTGNEWSNSLPKSSRARKIYHHHAKIPLFILHAKVCRRYCALGTETLISCNKGHSDRDPSLLYYMTQQQIPDVSYHKGHSDRDPSLLYYMTQRQSPDSPPTGITNYTTHSLGL